MKRIGAIIATWLLLSTSVSAQSGLDAVYRSLEQQGYSQFKTVRNGNHITVEGHRGEDVRELVYDTHTGRLMSDEVAPGRGGGTHDNQNRDHDGSADHGGASTGHDTSTDHGSTSTSHDTSTGHGGTSTGHDTSTDHGGASAGHDTSTNHGDASTGHDGPTDRD